MSTGFRIECEADTGELRRLQRALERYPSECKKGMISAINKSLQSTNSAMQKAITERYNVQKRALNGGDTFRNDSSNNLIRQIKATQSNLGAQIVVRGSRLSLVSARGMVTPKGPKSHRGKTMRQIKRMASPSVKILKSGRKRYGHSFVAKGRGGVNALFSRDRSTGKLVMQRTLSPANMAKEDSVVSKTQNAATEALSSNVTHEIRYRLGRVRT